MNAMKKLLALLVVVTVVTSVTGCGCCRRVRDMICRGAYCGPTATVPAPAPVTVAPLAAACPSCPPTTMAYDPSCGYSGVETLGYGGYPMVSPMVDSGWSASCSDCQGGVISTPSYDLPSYDSTYQPTDSGTRDPGPATVN